MLSTQGDCITGEQYNLLIVVDIWKKLSIIYTICSFWGNSFGLQTVF